jgi:hypothetical protein
VAFWDCVKVAAKNLLFPDEIQTGLPHGRWPRGAERRHFRGEKCVEAVKQLSWITPERLIGDLLRPVRHQNTLRAEVVMGRIVMWPMFGPWIAFKAADMLERLFDAPIEFSDDLVLYKEPRAALDLLPSEPLGNTQWLISHFSKAFLAPPNESRRCNVQEVETVLCKWKSHVNGHYWVGKDIHEIRAGLKGWGVTAKRLLDSCPEELPHDH